MTTRDEITLTVRPGAAAHIRRLLEEDAERADATGNFPLAEADRRLAVRIAGMKVAPTPAPGEPTAHEIEAGAKALWGEKLIARNIRSDTPFGFDDPELIGLMRTYAKAVLDAARAARATGAGASE